MNTLKLTLLMIAATVAGVAAFAGLAAVPSGEELRDPVSLKVIDDFLADSKRYLEL